jgi:hypothetical protein
MKIPKQIRLCMQYHTKGHNAFFCQSLVTELQIPIDYYDVPCGFIYLNSVQLKPALLIKRHIFDNEGTSNKQKTAVLTIGGERHM